MSKTATCGTSGKALCRCLNSQDIGRVVQGSQRDKPADRLNDLLVDHCRLAKHLAPVDHAVADPQEFRFVLYYPMVPVHLGHKVEPLVVVCQRLRITLYLEGSVFPSASPGGDARQRSRFSR